MLNRRASLALALPAVLILLSGAPAPAQMQTGNLYGTVADEQGSTLAGVAVTLRGPGAPQAQVTNEYGQFRFLGLTPNSYSLAAALEGFASVSYPNITINVGRNTQIEIVLTLQFEEGVTLE